MKVSVNPRIGLRPMVETSSTATRIRRDGVALRAVGMTISHEHNTYATGISGGQIPAGTNSGARRAFVRCSNAYASRISVASE